MQEERKALRTFCKRLLILALVIALSDQAAGWWLRRLFYGQESGEWYRARWTMDSSRAPILILGSSRASHHYVPAMLDSALGMPAYNGGRDGNDILGNLAFYRAVTKRYSPRLVILELLPREMYIHPESYERLSTLLPFYRPHPEIRDILFLRGPFEKWKLMSAVYPFNSQLVRLVNGSLNLHNDPANRYAGFLPLKGSNVSGLPDNRLPEPTAAVDPRKMLALREITSGCKQIGTRLVLVNSPVYSNNRGGTALDSIQAVCRSYGLSYWDFSTDARFDGHPELFRDNSHLNETGASVFTELLADRIKKEMPGFGSDSMIRNYY